MLEALEPCFRNFSLAVLACVDKLSSKIFTSAIIWPKDLDTQIFFLSAGTSSSSIQGIPRNSFTNLNPTTLKFFFIQESFAFISFKAVSIPCFLSSFSYWRPTPQISPTSKSFNSSLTSSCVFK